MPVWTGRHFHSCFHNGFRPADHPAGQKQHWRHCPVGIGTDHPAIHFLLHWVELYHRVKGSILNATSTFMIVILAHFAYKNDRITVKKAVGCLLGFAGVVLVNLGGGGFEGFFLFGKGASCFLR